MGAIASQITSLTIVSSTVYSGADHKKHESSAPLAFVREIHRGPVNSPHKWPVTRKMFPCDDVIMCDLKEWFDLIFCFIDTGAITWWRHKMETLPRYQPFVRGIHRLPMNSPHKGQWRRALMFCLICAWTNGWVNNRDVGDLRRHRAHYDVTVMICSEKNVMIMMK